MLVSQPAFPSSLSCFLLYSEVLAFTGVKLGTFRQFSRLSFCMLRLLTLGEHCQGMMFIWAVLQPCTSGGVLVHLPPQKLHHPIQDLPTRLSSEVHGLPLQWEQTAISGLCLRKLITLHFHMIYEVFQPGLAHELQSFPQWFLFFVHQGFLHIGVPSHWGASAPSWVSLIPAWPGTFSLKYNRALW